MLVDDGQTFRDSHISELIADAERRGAAQVLREIAKLPNPAFVAAAPTEQTRGDWWRCRWCEAHWQAGAIVSTLGGKHPDNGCLWPRALAVVTPETGAP